MLKNDELIVMYQQLLEIRYCIEKMEELKTKGIIIGPTHLEKGQEAIAVGASYPLNKDEYITCAHRNHGNYITKVEDVKRIFAEILGKKTGCCSGRAGHMIMANKDIGLLGGTGIVGGMIPIAVGYGLAFQVKGSARVALSFFGEGASNEGYFHESLNMAAVWKLPCVFICENNTYALSASAKEILSIADVADRATSYGIPGTVIDGNDPIAVYEAVSIAVEKARNNEGPSLIEAKTYRLSPFSNSDTGHYGGYRTVEEVEEAKKKEPIRIFEKKLLEMKIIDKKDVLKIQEEMHGKIEDAVAFAESSPDPNPDDIFEFLYQ